MSAETSDFVPESAFQQPVNLDWKFATTKNQTKCRKVNSDLKDIRKLMKHSIKTKSDAQEIFSVKCEVEWN